MSKFKKLFKEPRVLLCLALLILGFIIIGYTFNTKGVIINSVELNSSTYNSGIRSPDPSIAPTSREKILLINEKEINNLDDYTKLNSNILLNSSVRLKTDKSTYIFIKDSDTLGLNIGNIPSSNLRKGLDLQGGTRVVLRPSEKLSNEKLQDASSILENRLNVFGLSDIIVKPTSDLEGNSFIIVEIAGVTKDEVRNLIATQGKFEAKIGNDTVFTGKDVTFVCQGGGSSCQDIVSPSCPFNNNGYSCRFEFEIHLSNEAASRHQAITEKLKIVPSASGQKILEKNIDFYLDGKQVDSLQVDAGLKGIKAERITISGPGTGDSPSTAQKNAINNKKKLQTFLITGSLPTKLDIEKIDTVSPLVGEAFTRNAILIGLVSLLAVSLVIYIRYRSFKVSIPIIFTMASEIFLILSFAALTKQNLDIASIAGIIASVGTGVDDQIVITDEVLTGGTSTVKQNIKKAFFIILTAYFATVVAMIPLLRAGAGLLRGFAVVTIVGVSIGVFITRPAFGAIVKVLMED